MSEYSLAYARASEELQRRLRPILYVFIACIIATVVVLYVLRVTSFAPVFLGVVVAGLIFGVLKRRVWRDLEVKHGLRNG